jgi:Spy/CpxP family protein refolding chaperone
MKRLFLSLVILLCFSLAIVNAQESRRDGRRGFALPQELNLTSEQQQKVELVNADFKAKMTELRGKSDLTKEDKRSKMKELRKEHRDAINNILTPEQQAKMKELQTKREKAVSMRGNKKQGKQIDMRAHHGDHGNHTKDLNLTDEQKQKIKTLNENYRTKTKELARQHRDDLNEIYTPEQQAKLKDMRKDFPKNRKFAYGGKDGIKLDEAGVAKLKSLKENYNKEKKAIELSRTAPDAQKQKLSDLRENFQKEKRQIIKEARKVKDNKPA